MPRRIRQSQGETIRIVTQCDDKMWLTWPSELTQVQGLAIPPMVHRTSRAPFQHGETLLGTVLRPRVVQVVLHLEGCARPEMWELRRRVINILNPLLGPFKFQVLFDTGDIYELRDVVFDAGFEASTTKQIQSNTQGIAFRMIAYDPVWFSAPLYQEISTPDVENWLVLPAAFPIMFGVFDAIAETINIINGGNWPSYPIITITGPLNNPIIENLTTDEELRLEYTLGATETVTIDTTPGRKTVMNNADENLLGYLSSDSDLATFHLDPSPLASNGINVLFFSGNLGIGGVSNFMFSWHDRFLGI